MSKAKGAAPAPQAAGATADWIFDSVVAFLSSPLWSTPIMSFIDQHCAIFDNEEEHKIAHAECHNVRFRAALPRVA